MKLFNKLKWIFIIAIVFCIVLATNLIDKRNFKSISDSIVSIYQDRLVVKNTILDMATIVNNKEVAFLLQDTAFIAANNAQLSRELETDIQSLSQAKLLGREEETINLLQKKLRAMLAAEEKLIESQFSDFENYNEIIKEVNKNLNVLAHIQLEEGKKQFMVSQRKIGTVELLTQIETYFLVFLAILALVIVLYKPTSKLENYED